MEITERWLLLVCLVAITNSRASDIEQKGWGGTELDAKRFSTLFGVSSVQGKRDKMEDEHAAVRIPSPGKGDFFGVFDGHGHQGAFISKFIKQHLPGCIDRCFNDRYQFLRRIDKNIPERDFARRLQATRYSLHYGFLLAQEKLKAVLIDDLCGVGGTTAVISLLRDGVVYFAWAGDSRAVLCSSGKVKFASKDHSLAKNEEERKRLKALGATFNAKQTRFQQRGFPSGAMGWMVSGLPMGRGFGNYDLAGYLEGCPEKLFISDPSIESFTLTDKDEFLILACDGVWDVLKNEEAVEIVHEHLAKKPGDVAGAATLLQETAINKGSQDNVTAMVVNLAYQEPSSYKGAPESQETGTVELS